MSNDETENRFLFDLIEKMLEYEPHKRITLEEALSHHFFSSLPYSLRHPDYIS